VALARRATGRQEQGPWAHNNGGGPGLHANQCGRNGRFCCPVCSDSPPGRRLFPSLLLPSHLVLDGIPCRRRPPVGRLSAQSGMPGRHGQDESQRSRRDAGWGAESSKQRVFVCLGTLCRRRPMLADVVWATQPQDSGHPIDRPWSRQLRDSCRTQLQPSPVPCPGAPSWPVIAR
jgi:hypothetical protein